MPTRKKSVLRSRQGRKNRAAGSRFELKVRNSLEKQKWIVDKWTNNVDLEKGILIKAKRKFNPFLKILGIGSGFPDLIAFKLSGKNVGYDIIGVEVKANGWLDKSEKEKCKFLLDNKVFSKILVAKRGKKRGQIEYVEFGGK